jgi:glycosidase
MIKNPDREYDRNGNENNPDYDPGKPGKKDCDKQELIAAFQMTYKGAPMIYYGDEVGMWGADDPHDRNPMVWSNLKYDDEIINESSGFHKGFGTFKVEQNKDVLAFYKKIISVHNSNPALLDGDVKFIYSNDETAVFAFERSDNDERIISVFNTGMNIQDFVIKLNIKKFTWQDLFSGDKGTSVNEENSSAGLKINMHPGSVKIFKIISAE